MGGRKCQLFSALVRKSEYSDYRSRICSLIPRMRVRRLNMDYFATHSQIRVHK